MSAVAAGLSKGSSRRSSGTLGRFEHDDRDAPLAGPALVGLIAGVEVHRLVPEPLALLALGLARDVLAGPLRREDLDAGVGPHVVHPGRVLRRAGLRADQDDPLAVRDEQERRLAHLAALRADGLEQ